MESLLVLLISTIVIMSIFIIYQMTKGQESFELQLTPEQEANLKRIRDAADAQIQNYKMMYMK